MSCTGIGTQNYNPLFSVFIEIMQLKWMENRSECAIKNILQDKGLYNMSLEFPTK